MRYLIHHRDFQILLIIDSPLVFFSNQVFSMLSHRTYLLLFSHLKEVENCFISATNEKPVADANCTTESGGMSRDLSLCVSRDNVHYVEPMKQCMVVICSVISAISCSPCCFCAIMPGSVASVLMRGKIGKTRTNFDEIY